MPDKCSTYHARFYCYQAISHSAPVTHSDPKRLTYMTVGGKKSHYCSPIQITVQQESKKWNKFLLSLTSDVVSGEIWSLLGVAAILLKAAAPGWYACLYVCVCERAQRLLCCCAAPVACWHCPNVSASRLHFCRLGRLPDSCFGIALRFLTETSQVSSPDSHCFFLSLSLLSLSLSL